MILPNNDFVKIAIFIIVGVIGPILSIKERNELPINTSFGLKWRRIKSAEAIAELLVGITGVVVFSLSHTKVLIPEILEYCIIGLAFTLLVCVGFVKDSYIKAKKCEKKEAGG